MVHQKQEENRRDERIQMSSFGHKINMQNYADMEMGI